ncbi:MAG TPA: hypothetical protein DHV26_07815 [Cytophagales bacterium]|nr:hypothetical protein [Cytophagales bacterium]HRG09221.1 hypothetical protein [Cyclobacteriaceae bacterium]
MRFFIILLVLVAAGCSPLYIPTTRNVPLFREQGEFQASVIASTGAEVQTALAVTDNIAIMANGSFLRQKISEPDPYTRSHTFVEGGIGYYKANRRSRIEIFAGYGLGKGTSYAQYYFFSQRFGAKDLVATGSYSRIFIQPSFGQNNRRFNLAFTPRISLVGFSEFSSSDNGRFPTQTVNVGELNEKPRLFIEPALTGKFPLVGNLQGMFQLGLNVKASPDLYFDYVPLQFALGIQLNTGSLRTRVY